MSTKNGTGRTKTDLSKLEETIEELHGVIGADLSSHGSVPKVTLELAVKYLEYLFDKTENNRLYHKRQNLIKNAALKLMKQNLGADELANIRRQVDAKLGDVRNPNETEEETE